MIFGDEVGEIKMRFIGYFWFGYFFFIFFKESYNGYFLVEKVIFGFEVRWGVFVVFWIVVDFYLFWIIW